MAKRIFRDTDRINCKLMTQYHKSEAEKPTIRTTFCVDDCAVYGDYHCTKCAHYCGVEFGVCGKVYIKKVR